MSGDALPCPMPPHAHTLSLACAQTLALSDAAQLDGEDARAAVLGRGGTGGSAEARRSQAKQVCSRERGSEV